MKQLLEKENKWLLIQEDTCDSEILGKTLDEGLEKEEVSLCVVYAKEPAGCKFVVGSKTNEVRANEVAAYLAKSVGAGGGQSIKAGGFLSECLLLVQRQNADYDRYFEEKIRQYFSQYQIVRAQDYQADLNQMVRYQKKKIKLGVVRTSDFLKEGTPILVRTLEGDMECVSAEDLYIMIGIDGEVYPIRKEKFYNSYEFTDGEPEYAKDAKPMIHNRITGEAYYLVPHQMTCQARDVYHIFARQLTESTKVFTQWDKYKYLKGVKGDYIAVREDDLTDVYTIEQSVFLRSYERCE